MPHAPRRLTALLTHVSVDLSRRQDFDPQFVFSPPLALGVLSVGVFIACLAALYPAALSARTAIADALRHE